MVSVYKSKIFKYNISDLLLYRRGGDVLIERDRFHLLKMTLIMAFIKVSHDEKTVSKNIYIPYFAKAVCPQWTCLTRFLLSKLTDFRS